MAITLDTITLPADLIWTDEYDWTPKEASESRTLTGALIIQTGTKQAGRPITLAGDDRSAWTTRATADALQAKLSTDTAMTLTLNDGRQFQVFWRHADKPLDTRPVVPYSEPAADDPYTLTLRLQTV